jgi:ribosome biogenesis GTPase A
LLAAYPDLLAQRYHFEVQGLGEEAALSAIGRRRGAVAAGGRLDLHKAAEALLNDFRAGSIGRITLETPQEFALWFEQAAVREAQRRARKLELERQRAGSSRPAGTPAPRR